LTLAKFAEVNAERQRCGKLSDNERFDAQNQFKLVCLFDLSDSKEGMSAIGCLRYFCPSASGGDFT
jgi:hypothetical protein